MEALALLKERRSQPRLAAPAPNQEQLAELFAAAMRAPDHAGLRPWHYKVFSGEGLNKLGKLLAEAASRDSDADEQRIEKMKNAPLRAPMVIVAVAKVVEHKKVPPVEQLISTGCGVMNMLNALYAMNMGGYWRTGPIAYNRELHSLLGLTESDQIVGFLYLGTPEGEPKPVKETDWREFVEFHHQ